MHPSIQASKQATIKQHKEGILRSSHSSDFHGHKSPSSLATARALRLHRSMMSGDTSRARSGPRLGLFTYYVWSETAAPPVPPTRNMIHHRPSPSSSSTMTPLFHHPHELCMLAYRKCGLEDSTAFCCGCCCDTAGGRRFRPGRGGCAAALLLLLLLILLLTVVVCVCCC